MVYLFAGKRRHSDIAAFLKKAERSGRVRLELHEFDIERSPQHDLTDSSLWDRIYSILKEGHVVLIVSPPCNTFSRARFQFRQHPGPKPLRTRTWPRGFPWLSAANRAKVDEANTFVDRCIKACHIVAEAEGHFILEHPEDLGTVEGEQPGSIWQWPEVLELIPACGATSFAIHQCKFGAPTPKPTRFMSNMEVQDARCLIALPKFDKLGYYKGPLPKQCGHVHTHKLIGRTATQWNTSPSAAYPARLCQFLADLILNASASYGGGVKDKSRKRAIDTSSAEAPQPPAKRPNSSAAQGVPGVGSQSLGKCDNSLSGIVIDLDSEGEHGTTYNNNGELVTAYNNTGDTGGQQVDEGPMAIASEVQFDMAACGNAGRPISVEWDRTHKEFTDGFGLCSPTRWKPSQRGVHRSEVMKQLADNTFAILEEAVMVAIPDVRREAFRLVTGKLDGSPFSDELLAGVRSKWFSLLADPLDAAVRDEGQPFYLRALSQWLKVFDDPDCKWLVDEKDSFSTGVCLGVEKPLPRSPQVCRPKLKHRRLDDTEFAAIAQNYPSAQISSKELEEKFHEEEALGRMHPTKLGVLRQQYGDRVRVAAMAAIQKPDGTVRPLHDATHSVMVNHAIKYQDKIDCPGPAEIASVVRETAESQEAPFCVSADIRAAHRLVKVRACDWGYMCCKADSKSETIWVNRTGTFGISSAPYWWFKLAALIGRFVGFLFQQRWLMHMIYVDDLHGVFTGERKFLWLWIWLLAFEMTGVPFGYHKFKGGFSSEFVGFQIRYDLTEVGISPKRGDWIVQWVNKACQNNFVVQARDFSEFLGRLGFIAQLLTWVKPHLAPLFSWAAVTAAGTVCRLPETVIITLHYLRNEFLRETFLVSARRPVRFHEDQFRTDAKCTDTFVVLAGWELKTRRWFALKLGPKEVPYLFKPDKGSQWASTSAELLASLTALHLFGWLKEQKERRDIEVSLFGGTDNRANESLTEKRSTTKWPLMGINMQLSSSLSRSRLSLGLRWRPREENVEADQLTNEDFTGFDESLRIDACWDDLQFKVLEDLVQTRESFVLEKARAKEMAVRAPKVRPKKFDKSPW